MVILVNTPGFDDTYRDEGEVLHEVAHSLSSPIEQHRTEGIRLAGVIYLHRITDPRIYPGIALVTNMWEIAERLKDGPRIAQQREKELRNPEYWGTMLEGGSKMTRHYGSKDSALQIVRRLVDLNVEVKLDIQPEMVTGNPTEQMVEMGSAPKNGMHSEVKETKRDSFHREKQREAQKPRRKLTSLPPPSSGASVAQGQNVKPEQETAAQIVTPPEPTSKELLYHDQRPPTPRTPDVRDLRSRSISELTTGTGGKEARKWVELARRFRQSLGKLGLSKRAER
ncbi:hypothetical protein QBC46DRAFT_417291 [Diplogelasinospora grovesii]|uniref:Uncharacterized protein n=1 Tax=Diplogelasinospora grovesii TaxID=303347 RepID=A0AAN6N0P3_9PEZI|nr:hypothetical protein QBC46DRAFT_417291 [Diplogelasinospora grovesii]